MRVLVTGATGRVGRHLVAELLQGGHEVRALTRDPGTAHFPEGVQAVGGDLAKVETLGSAFDGIDAIHFITFGGEDYADLTNGADLVDLAERSGARRATVLGSWSSTSVDTEVQRSTMGWTLLHPVEFMANMLDWADELKASGTMSALAGYPSAMIHEADIAAVAARALTETGHTGRTYPLTGPEALTPRERVRILAEETGRDLSFVELTVDQERTRLRGYGYDDDYVEFGIHLATSPPAEAGEVLPTVETVTGCPARTFAEWAHENAARFQPVDGIGSEPRD